MTPIYSINLNLRERLWEAGRWDEEQKTVQIFVIELEKSSAVIMQSQLESDEVVGDISGIEDYDYC